MDRREILKSAKEAYLRKTNKAINEYDSTEAVIDDFIDHLIEIEQNES